MIVAMATFAVRRSYRPGVLYAGLAWLVACIGAAIAGVAIAGPGEWLPVAIGAGMVGLMIASFAAARPQRATLHVEPGRVVPSWRGEVRLDARPPELGIWMLGGLDVPTGVIAHVHGHGGTLRIGGDQHDGRGYALAAAPSRAVDCALAARDFEALLAALGVHRGAPGALVVPLSRNGQTFRGFVRTAAPWFATMAAAAAAGILGSALGLGDSRAGMLAMSAIVTAIVIGGMIAMILRSRRVRGPAGALRFEAHALVLVRGDGSELATPWHDVRVERRRYRLQVRTGTYPMPVLRLTLGAETLTLGAWDTSRDWPDDVPSARAPTWLAASALWPALVHELARAGRAAS